jgi:putative ABC transport system substrate-binding protein
MRRRDLLGLIAGMTAAWPLSAHGQQKTMPVVGWLFPGRLPRNPTDGPIHDGLRETGYIEGENFTAEYRSADGNYDRLPALAQDLVGRKVDLIVTVGGTPTALAAKNATSTIPIVFGSVSDPVAAGLVTSLARPGGNVTGVADLSAELMAKQFEVLIELVPRAKVIALLVNPANPPVAEHLIKTMPGVANSKGLDLSILKAASDDEIEAAFATLAQLRADALLLAGDFFFVSRSDRLAQLAEQHSIPTGSAGTAFVRAGGLVSLGTDDAHIRRQAGIYAGRILKGEKPANLPVQQPSKFWLAINLKAAKALGITVPHSLLLRADEIIE